MLPAAPSRQARALPLRSPVASSSVSCAVASLGLHKSSGAEARAPPGRGIRPQGSAGPPPPQVGIPEERLFSLQHPCRAGSESRGTGEPASPLPGEQNPALSLASLLSLPPLRAPKTRPQRRPQSNLSLLRLPRAAGSRAEKAPQAFLSSFCRNRRGPAGGRGRALEPEEGGRALEAEGSSERPVSTAPCSSGSSAKGR